MATILSSKNNLRLERSNQKVSWIEGHWHMRIRTIPALIFSFLVYYDSTTSFHHLEAIRRTHENLYDGLCCVLVLTFLPFCKIEWRLHDNSICLCESGKSVSCRTWKWKSKIHRKFQLFIIHLVGVNFEDYEQCFGAISSEIYLWMFPILRSRAVCKTFSKLDGVLQSALTPFMLATNSILAFQNYVCQ